MHTYNEYIKSLVFKVVSIYNQGLLGLTSWQATALKFEMFSSLAHFAEFAFSRRVCQDGFWKGWIRVHMRVFVIFRCVFIFTYTYSAGLERFTGVEQIWSMQIHYCYI